MRLVIAVLAVHPSKKIKFDFAWGAPPPQPPITVGLRPPGAFLAEKKPCGSTDAAGRAFMDPIRVHVDRHGLMFGQSEANHLQEAF